MVERTEMALVFLATMTALSLTYLAVWAFLAPMLRLGVARFVLGSGPVVMQT
jgi:hypothetical protein